MDNKEAVSLSIRYLILILLGIFLSLFYFVFMPLTVWPVYWFLSFLDAGTRMFEGNMIFFKGEYIEIIGACVAGAAYYLLLILNLGTPMNALKRVKSISFLFASFLLLNISRIVLFSVLLAGGFQFFDLAHKLTWYFGSTILVVAIWFVNVWLVNIREIPIYSDVMALFKDVFDGDKTKRGNR